MLVNIKDESFSGKVLNDIEISFKQDKTSIKNIIKERVLHEVELYNKKGNEYAKGLVVPSKVEQILNGDKSQKKQFIDGEKQVYVALEAFQRNGFFVLIDNVQYEDLNQEIVLHPEINISFIKLTPLVGG